MLNDLAALTAAGEGLPPASPLQPSEGDVRKVGCSRYTPVYIVVHVFGVCEDAI
jgi:hypothetical protein